MFRSLHRSWPRGCWKQEPCLSEEAKGGALGWPGRAAPGSATCTSLPTQASYLKLKGLGGAMVWVLDMDDFAGFFCNQGHYPLIKALQLELSE